MVNPNMGRPRKPASLQTGNNISKTEKKRLAAAEQEIKGNDDLIYDIPEHLDDLAIKYYNFIINQLKETDLLSNLDKPLVEQVADALSKIRQCDEILNSEGVLITEINRSGNELLKEHPTVSTKMKYLDRFRTLSTQLGMSPSSRAALAALNVEKIEEDSDQLLNILKG